jgi:DNA-binding MarR family transcriptional regulator
VEQEQEQVTTSQLSQQLIQRVVKLLQQHEIRDKARHEQLAAQIQTLTATASTSTDEAGFTDLTLSELHTLDNIGIHGMLNGISLATQMEMTKGAISKITVKLISKGLIERYSFPNNRKEIYFRLTRLGHKVFNVHRELHENLESQISQILAAYTTSELQFLLRVLNDLSSLLGPPPSPEV